ncbi:MAG TPA: 4a-hydroxytetrahydrobiopterin dehydratase [Steroidobacteraceae bacterium]|nr:4a-hydroxytetrahydrobiopterin dehydratase [Steroidobacteraceae bacterium]
MSTLREMKCTPCPPGTPALAPDAARALLVQLGAGWRISDDGKALRKAYRFANFHDTMGFVNAVAWIANGEDHHPDLEVGYDYCRMTFATHSIGGLSQNDFICAAKVDALGA